MGINSDRTNPPEGEVGRNSLEASILPRNIRYIKHLENKTDSLAKYALDYESFHTEQRATILSLLKKIRK